MSRTNISLTAWLVMISQLQHKRTKRWGELVCDRDAAFYEESYKYCRAVSPIYRFLSLLPKGFSLWLVECALAKGAPLHYVLRKKAVIQQVRSGISAGVQQVVLIGGGFDPLALHIAQDHSGVHTFEIDLPSMYVHKSNIIKIKGGGCANHHLISRDLADKSLADVLINHPWYFRDRPTLFIAEGISMYLSEQRVVQWMEDMKTCCTQGVSVIFTAVADHKNNPGGFAGRIRRFFLSLYNERFFWGIPPHDMKAFLQRFGFTQRYLIPYIDLQKRYRTPEELSRLEQVNGEYIVYADAR